MHKTYMEEARIWKTLLKLSYILVVHVVKSMSTKKRNRQ